VRAFKWCPW